MAFTSLVCEPGRFLCKHLILLPQQVRRSTICAAFQPRLKHTLWDPGHDACPLLPAGEINLWQSNCPTGVFDACQHNGPNLNPAESQPGTEVGLARGRACVVSERALAALRKVTCPCFPSMDHSPMYAAQCRARRSFLSKALMFAPLARSRLTICKVNQE